MFEEYGYSDFLIERYLRLFGEEETKQLLEANERPLKKSIRINTIKISVDDCISRLEKKGFVFSKVLWCDYGFIVEKSKFSIGATPEFLLGYYYVQDSTSMIPAIELDPKPNEIVADIAAAPGGKTTHLAQLMQNNGVIVAADINLNKMKALRSNVQRCGVTNVIALNNDVESLSKFDIKFDKILLDAPCSAEGAIIKIKERRKTIKPGDFKYYSEKQKSIVDTAKTMLKKGGVLVYSTCSIAPEENELVIEHALKNGFEVLDISNKHCSPGLTEFFGEKHDQRLKKCCRFYPHKHGTQGFFVAKLRKI
jgi:NOL1/NOP2/sun family putative RNA methylase